MFTNLRNLVCLCMLMAAILMSTASLNAQNGFFTITIDSSTCNATYVTFTLDTNVTFQSWDFGDGSQSNANDTIQHVYVAPGTYIVTMTYASSPFGSTTITDQLLVTGIFGVSVSVVRPTCNAACDGSITLSTSGGANPISYNWSTGGTSDTLTNLCAGTYIYTVTEGGGCVTVDSLTLTDPLPLALSLTPNTGVCGPNSGSISATVAGGSAPYSFQWSNGSTTQNLAGLSAGTYFLTVFDANGCSVTDMATVGTSTGTPVTLQTVVTSPCDTSCNGMVDLTVTGGTTPYIYFWSNSNTSEDLQGACAGLYSVTVSDANGCTAATTVRLSGGIISYQVGNITTADCNMANGAVNLAMSGFQPLSILWDANAGSSNATNVTGLAPGAYSFTITDVGGCERVGSVTVPEDTFALTGGVTSTTCGAADGTAFVSYQHNLPVTVNWSNGDTTDAISGLLPGIYSVTVTDTAGCAPSLTLEVKDSCGAIQGFIYEDLNGNGTQDVGETGFAGLTVTAMPGSLTTLTDQNGNYSIPIINFGTYTVTSSSPANRFGCSGQAVLQPQYTFPVSGSHSAVVSAGAPVSTGNDFAINFPPPPCGIISGTVFDDQNGNGVQDAGEGGMPSILVQLSNGQQVYTNTQGYYEVETAIDSPLVVSIYLPNNGTGYCNSQPSLTPTQTSPTNPDTYSVTLTAQNPNSFNNDFGVQNTLSDFDAAVYSIRAYAGIHAGTCFTAWMDFKIRGTLPSACTLRLEFDTLVHFVSASITPDNSGPGFVEWIFPAGTSNYTHCMQMRFCLDEAAVAGMQLDWYAFWSCGTNDGCAYNDEMDRSFTVQTGPAKAEGIGGFNKKEVFHSGDIFNNLIGEEDTVLSYVINFQNTGTDTAYHLTIRDTLSPYLKPESLTRAFSSHDHSYFLTSDNVVVWQFENINLPDSTADFGSSYGFVQYNITVDKGKLKDGITFGNSACLYWNYDDPNCTNKALLTYDTDVAVEEVLTEENLRLYPNPTTGEFVIQTKGIRLQVVEVLDLLGSVILRDNCGSVDQNRCTLSLGSQQRGIYMVRIHTNEGITTRKLVLMD